jgi:hypothetical protein
MKSLSAAELSALAARSLAFRNLVWITAKNRTTGALTPFGFWDDVGTRALQVIDVLTGATVTRNFVGAGSLLQIDDVVATSELQVRELVIRLSGVDATVANAVRGYDARLAPIQVYRLMLNPASGAPIAAARARFVGIVDSLKINDPTRGGQGNVIVSAASQMRELSRANPDMISDPSQKQRAEGTGKPTDRFYQYTNEIANWSIAWGALSPKAQRRNKKGNKKDNR